VVASLQRKERALFQLAAKRREKKEGGSRLTTRAVLGRVRKLLRVPLVTSEKEAGKIDIVSTAVILGKEEKKVVCGGTKEGEKNDPLTQKKAGKHRVEQVKRGVTNA